MAAPKGFRIQFTALGQRQYKSVAEGVQAKIEAYAHAFMKNIIADAQGDYQRVAPSLGYRRRYILYVAWSGPKRHGSGSSIRFEISNYASRDGKYYASLVHGLPTRPEYQWPLHAARGWRTVEQIRDSRGGREVFTSVVQDIINRSVQRAGV